MTARAFDRFVASRRALQILRQVGTLVACGLLMVGPVADLSAQESGADVKSSDYSWRYPLDFHTGIFRIII